jgi:hypothetical protein
MRQRSSMRTTLGLALVITLLGCSGRESVRVQPLDIPDGCSPLLHQVSCALPYPSNHFLVDDATLPSGHRVQIDGAAELWTSNGEVADLTEFMPQDGFSRQPPIVWGFGVRVDESSVPGMAADPTSTLATGFPLALVDAATKERVPFFVDVDPRATDDAREALIMRPLVPLKANTRYVVVVSGVSAVSGELPVPVAMARLVGGDAAVGSDRILRPLLQRYEAEIFPIVAAAGISRANVQLAWDFTTGSDEHVQHDLLRARTLALQALAQTPPTARVTRFLEDEQIAQKYPERPELNWRLIELSVTGPRVVENDDAGTLLARDDDGEVRLNGVTTFNVMLVIPESVRDSDEPIGVDFFGHGFFGDRNEMQYSKVREFSNRTGHAEAAIDWIGMSYGDLGVVAGSMGNNVSEALRFGERLPQAMINWLTLTALIKNGGLDDVTTVVVGTTEVKPLRRPGTNTPLLRRDTFTFLGNSMGHILGAVAVALNGDIKRAVFRVGGSGLSHMMFRARPFVGFTFFLDSSLPDPLDQQILTAQLQRAADRFDPATWAPYLLTTELPEGPSAHASERRVLQQIGRGDTQVPNLGSLLHMRAMGLPWLTPGAFKAPFGVTTEALPYEGSGTYMYNFGVDPSFELEATFPAEEGFVHYVVGANNNAVEQGVRFMLTGVVENPCAPNVCGVQR